MILLVMSAGLVAGFLNVLAGGGSFVTVPVLVAAGLSMLGADASSTVGLFPAELLTAAMVRGAAALPAAADGPGPWGLAAIALGGGGLGAVLLLLMPPELFTALVPWLTLFATGVVARGGGTGPAGFRLGRRGAAATLAAVSIYGGYFGGGTGILVLAALTACGGRDIRATTAVKLVLAALTSAVAAAFFAFAGLVQGLPAAALAVAAMAGGVAGLRVMARLPAHRLRLLVVAVGLLLTVGLLLRPA